MPPRNDTDFLVQDCGLGKTLRVKREQEGDVRGERGWRKKNQDKKASSAAKIPSSGENITTNAWRGGGDQDKERDIRTY